MGLILYRRHNQACGKDRRFRRCSCPIWVQGSLGGEAIRKALNLSSWDAAENLIREWTHAGKIGVEGRKRITIKDAVEKFLADAKARQLREGTIELYEQTLQNQFVPWCEKESIFDLSKVDAEMLVRHRAEWKCKPVTAARRIDRLRTFFSFCLDLSWIEKNPVKALKAPVTRSTSKIPFTEDELTAIYAACDELVTHGSYGKENRARVKAFVYILRYTGLRISDATRLDESRVKDGRVFIRTEKTGQLVWVPIPEFVVDALAQVPRVGSFYFQTGNAKPKTVRGGWDRTIRTILTLAGVKHGSAHVFRHSFATELLSKGVPVETVAAILGNSPAIVLKHYSHWIKSRQEAMESAVRMTWEEPKPKLKLVRT
jgi:site-specific recombinase XerD